MGSSAYVMDHKRNPMPVIPFADNHDVRLVELHGARDQVTLLILCRLPDHRQEIALSRQIYTEILNAAMIGIPVSSS